MKTSRDENYFDLLPKEIKFSIFFKYLSDRDVKAVLTTNTVNNKLKEDPKYWLAKVVSEMETAVPTGFVARDFYALREERTQVVTYLLAVHCKTIIKNTEDIPLTEMIQLAYMAFEHNTFSGFAEEIHAAGMALIEACSGIVDTTKMMKALYHTFDEIVISQSESSWETIQTLIQDDISQVPLSQQAIKNLTVVVDLISAIGIFGATKSLRAFNNKVASAPGASIPEYVFLNMLQPAIIYGQIDLIKELLVKITNPNAVCMTPLENGKIISRPLLAIAALGLLKHTRCSGGAIDLTRSKDADEHMKISHKISVFIEIVKELLSHGANPDLEYSDILSNPFVLIAGPVFYQTTPRQRAAVICADLPNLFHLSEINKALLGQAAELISTANRLDESMSAVQHFKMK